MNRQDYLHGTKMAPFPVSRARIRSKPIITIPISPYRYGDGDDTKRRVELRRAKVHFHDLDTVRCPAKP
jgi:hypothetical protein